MTYNGKIAMRIKAGQRSENPKKIVDPKADSVYIHDCHPQGSIARHLQAFLCTFPHLFWAEAQLLVHRCVFCRTPERECGTLEFMVWRSVSLTGHRACSLLHGIASKFF
jgi:hypothetical protein